MSRDAHRLRVTAGTPYEVVVGHRVLTELPALVQDALRVAVLHPAPRPPVPVIAALAGGPELTTIEVPDGERAKSAAVLQHCWEVLGAAGFTRSDAVIGYGGGSVTDLAGFVAATWLRGIRCVHVPTTLLAMVDAAVGGKTGINTAAGKNLVGAFWEPAGVLCDLDTLASLPAAEYASGMAEVVKCGFVADPAILDLIETDPAAALSAGGRHTLELIGRSLTVKIAAVTGDLREQAAAPGGASASAGDNRGGSDGGGSSVGREALNYGHTFGHAVERVENFGWRHGAAVGVGMVFVAELARRVGLVDDALVSRHRAVLAGLGLPVCYRGAGFEELLAAMRLDKKSRGTMLRFVVLAGLARPRILSGPDEAVLRACYEALA